MARVKITYTKSMIGSPKRHKLTMAALGLRKLNHSVEHELTPQIQGMINKVDHLLKVEEL